jgi:hypothetical protein
MLRTAKTNHPRSDDADLRPAAVACYRYATSGALSKFNSRHKQNYLENLKARFGRVEHIRIREEISLISRRY